MNDPTETIRRNRIAEINVVPGSREDLENRYGQVWDTNQLSEEFQAIGFMAPLIVVRRKSDGVKGSLEFQHSPRLYFNWQPVGEHHVDQDSNLAAGFGFAVCK